MKGPIMTPYDMIKHHMTENIAFARLTGANIVSIGDGVSEVVMDQREETENHIGSQHAGALFTLGETASGAAFSGAMAPVIMAVRPVAAEARIAYTKIAKGTITAHGKSERPGAELMKELDEIGKITFDVHVKMTDSDGEEVANMTVHWHVKKNS